MWATELDMHNAWTCVRCKLYITISIFIVTACELVYAFICDLWLCMYLYVNYNYMWIIIVCDFRIWTAADPQRFRNRNWRTVADENISKNMILFHPLLSDYFATFRFGRSVQSQPYQSTRRNNCYFLTQPSMTRPSSLCMGPRHIRS
jgi:hypothetical protein